ncbi:hypothetical protein SBA4_220013 [Candidatus Sulfopaludibacter sp. SbA4]|nr:hypothetical protein SBA4_220013 [Candidatus Sulfopaludibacter sp. SbA4]
MAMDLEQHALEERGAVAELALGGVRGVGEALAAEFSRTQIEVQLHFVFEIAGKAIFVEKEEQAAFEFTSGHASSL